MPLFVLPQSPRKVFEILPIIPVHSSLINQMPRIVQDIPFNLPFNPLKTMR